MIVSDTYVNNFLQGKINSLLELRIMYNNFEVIENLRNLAKIKKLLKDIYFII